MLIKLNGINLLRIPARDAYAYALSLMDALFTKQELSSSLIFYSKKSDKPALDRERVDKLLGKYKSTYIAHFLYRGRNRYHFQTCISVLFFSFQHASTSDLVTVGTYKHWLGKGTKSVEIQKFS